jgi:hypothetical protein
VKTSPEGKAAPEGGEDTAALGMSDEPTAPGMPGPPGKPPAGS